MNKLNFKKINKLIFWIIGLIYLISLTFQFNDTDLYYILHTGNYLMDNIHNETEKIEHTINYDTLQKMEILINLFMII